MGKGGGERGLGGEEDIKGKERFTPQAKERLTVRDAVVNGCERLRFDGVAARCYRGSRSTAAPQNGEEPPEEVQESSGWRASGRTRRDALPGLDRSRPFAAVRWTQTVPLPEPRRVCRFRRWAGEAGRGGVIPHVP